MNIRQHLKVLRVFGLIFALIAGLYGIGMLLFVGWQDAWLSLLTSLMCLGWARWAYWQVLALDPESSGHDWAKEPALIRPVLMWLSPPPAPHMQQRIVSFKKIFLREVGPRLAEWGFRRGAGPELTSGRSRQLEFLRHRPPFVDCISLVKPVFGKTRLHLGLHLDFLPGARDVAGGPVDLERFSESECELQADIKSREWNDYHYWPARKGDPDQIKAICKDIEMTLEQEVLPLFAAFDRLPGPLESISTTTLFSPAVGGFHAYTIERLVLLLARVHAHLGQHDKAHAFARWGLAHVNDRSTLSPLFRQILASKSGAGPNLPLKQRQFGPAPPWL